MAADAVGIRLNYVVNCRLSVTCNTGGASGGGTALELRQSALNLFLGGSYGNARVGIRVADGYSYGNVFVAPDIEEVQRCVEIASPYARSNTWTGGTFVYRGDHAVFVQASGPGNLFGNVNVAPVVLPGAPGVDSATFFAGDLSGVHLTEREGGVGTPTLPPSGAWLQNPTGRAVLVTVHDGAVSQVSVRPPGDGGPGAAVGNPVTGAVLTRLLRPGWSIQVTYAGSPGWLWEAVE